VLDDDLLLLGDLLVVVDDRVEQGVHEERRPAPDLAIVRRQPGPGHVHRPLRAVVEGQDVARADEARDLCRFELSVLLLEFVDDDEQMLVVFLELRTLLRLGRVLDGELVQAELDGDRRNVLRRERADVGLGPHARAALVAQVGDH
jgi:hypothetical protein